MSKSCEVFQKYGTFLNSQHSFMDGQSFTIKIRQMMVKSITVLRLLMVKSVGLVRVKKRFFWYEKTKLL